MARDRISSLLRRRDWFEAFAKQELEGKWRPIPNLKWTIVFYAVLTIITIPLGGGIYHSTLKNSNFSTRYDEGGNSTVIDGRFLEALFSGIQNFTMTVKVTEKMESPVYLYYELKDYYQNHKRYVRSAAFNQIAKGDISRSELSVCEPYKILEPDTLPLGDDRTPDERVINPCGLVAHSYFNDSFTLISSTDAGGENLGLRLKEDGIATEWDRKYLYGDHNATNFNKNSTTRGGGTIIGPLDEDERFMVWMKVGSRPTIRKLYAIIEEDIPEGALLTFEINNRYNTYDYGGEKRLILSTANWTGGRNVFTGALFFAIGGASALACFAILLFDRYTERNPGDLRELSWIKKKNS